MNPIIIAGAKLLLTNPAARNGAKFLLETAFNSVTKSFSKNMSLEEVTEKYSPKLKNIVEQYRNEGLAYQAGRFKIIHLDDESFALNFDLYFTDSDGKWINAENTSSALDSKTWLSPSARIDLREEKEKIFSLNF